MNKYYVSIQLVSPASGDSKPEEISADLSNQRVSIQLVSPASGDEKAANESLVLNAIEFPFN